MRRIKKYLLLTIISLTGLAGCTASDAQKGSDQKSPQPSAEATATPAKLTTEKKLPVEAKTPELSAEDIKNGSVKADDYDENMKSADGTKEQCDALAFVADPDYGGLNMRLEGDAGSSIVGNIPYNPEGTIVHISGTNYNGWLKIDRVEKIDGEVILRKEGYVAGNLLAVITKGDGVKGDKIYEAGPGTKVLTTVPPRSTVKLSTCSEHSLRVKYKNFDGWLEAGAICADPLKKCS